MTNTTLDPQRASHLNIGGQQKGYVMTRNYSKAQSTVKTFVAKGYHGDWNWDQVAAAVAKDLGIALPEDRAVEATTYAQRVVQGAYPNNPKSWVKIDWSAVELEHVVKLIEFSLEFTLTRRPKPVVEKKAEVAEKSSDPTPAEIEQRKAEVRAGK